LVGSLRPALIAFVAFDRNRVPRIAGTGFIVAAEPEFALVCSAKHVFTEGVLAAQRPTRTHAASAIVVRAVDKTPSLDPNKLKVVRQESTNATMLNIDYLNYNDILDIAACVLRPQEGESIAERLSIPLDTRVPSVGDVVHMVALEDMEVRELAPPGDWSGEGQQLSIFRRISIRVGVVTGVYPKGLRHYRWPAFTTSIPAKPGMSGGFVYRPREGVPIAACGIVCADSSTEESHQDFFHCGDSVVGCAWPAIALRLPLSLPSYPKSPIRTLFEMVRRGLVPAPLGGIERFNLTETANGDCIIHEAT